MNKTIFVKFVTIIFIVISIGFLCGPAGLSAKQTTAVCIFLFSILSSLFFWEFRMSFVFLGTSLLLLTKISTITDLVKNSSLEIILFLAGMMIVIGLLKNVGVFAWMVSLILRMKNFTAGKFMIVMCVVSALSSCALDEVTSIIFMVAAILEVCEYFEVNPIPFIISSVLATNIGSSGTVLGNPIGILIASKSGLTFEDFIVKAFPVMCISLFVSIILIMIIYRKAIREFNNKIKGLGYNEILTRLISVPPDLDTRFGIGIFLLTVIGISLHHRLEIHFGLETNTILLIMPLITGGAAMVWRYRKAREFVEKDVEWWTLIFFLFLFAQAGTLMQTGATDVLARHLIECTKGNFVMLTSMVLWISAIGSSVLDNVVLVASFIPIIKSLSANVQNVQPLWWALLFGGCFGGNITIIGSTANMVAVGILEKERKPKITFKQWIFAGLTVGIVSTAIVWLILVMFFV